MTNYLSDLIASRLDNQVINAILNEALIDKDCKPDDYAYLATVAKSLGFSFGDDFEIKKLYI